MRSGTIAVLGIAAYGIFLVATMPARYFAAKLESAAPARYEVHEAQGTIWNGHAKAVVRAPGSTLVVDRVEWAFLPARLASARIAFAITAKGAAFDASYEAARSFSGWSLRGLAARADAAVAVAALPWLAHWRPEGTVNASASSIDVAGSELRGALDLEWTGAAVALSEVKPLGSYRAEVRADGGPAKIVVSTLRGPLRLSGQGTLELPARLAFKGEARAEGANARALDPLMDLFGPAKADGARAIDWRTR